MGGNSNDRGLDIKVSKQLDVYVTGFFQGTVDFDPSSNTSNVTANGGEEIFLTKFDSSGNFLWVNSYGSNSGSYIERGYELQVDDLGNSFLCGSFSGTVDFDASSSTTNKTSSGDEDGFLTKVSSNGSLNWVKTWGGSDEVIPTTVYINKNNIYIGGAFQGTVDFNPGSGVSSQTSKGNRDAFVMKLDSIGGFVWAKAIGTSSADITSGITVDQNENITFTGYYFDFAIDCDPGTSIFNLSNSGSNDSYVCQLDKNGDFNWAYSISSSGLDISNGVISDQSGNLYVAGAFSGSSIDFDPQSSTEHRNSNGNYDAFIQKIRDCKASADTLFEQACNSYTSPSGLYTWTKNGTYYDTLLNYLGCDSILQINLFITKATATIDTTVCSSFISPSRNYQWGSSGTYLDTIPQSFGCDSVYTINLTVLNKDTSFTVLACKNYISPSGKTNWTSSGLYQDTLPSSLGCDSTITVTLALVQPDTSITANAPTLTSNASGGNIAYQWLDCSNNYSKITGATSKTFNATYNGNFAVEINNSGCKDTSACYQIISVGIDNNSFINKSVDIFPNPNNGLFLIHVAKNYINLSPQFILLDMHGKSILNGSLTNVNSKIEYKGISKGIYFLQLYFKNGEKITKKVIIN